MYKCYNINMPDAIVTQKDISDAETTILHKN